MNNLDEEYDELHGKVDPDNGKPQPSEVASILQKSNTTLTLPTPLQQSDSLKQAQRLDVQVTNDMLTTCYHGLGQAKSLSSLFRGIETTLKVIETRRKVLNLEYGFTSKGVGKGYTEPLDD